jgi:hypothetical protein
MGFLYKDLFRPLKIFWSVFYLRRLSLVQEPTQVRYVSGGWEEMIIGSKTDSKEDIAIDNLAIST